MWVNDAWTGSVGVLCTPEKMLSLSGRISMTSTPTPTTMSTVDNKELPNERWTKYELGPVFSISDFLRLTVTGYYYDVKDAKTQAIDENGNHMTIVTEDGDAITVYDANKQLSRKGFEAMAEGKVLKYFNYNVGYSYFSSSLASEDTTMVRYKFTGMLGFHKDRVEATLSMVKVPEYWSNNAKVGNYTLWNANVGFDVTNKLKISLFARNLTDQKYATRYKGVGSGYFYDIGAIYGIEFKIKI
jgi:outer membrane receptor for ferrienterochelin and colicin